MTENDSDGDAYRKRLVDANDRRVAGKATEEDLKLINTARACHGYRPLPSDSGDAA